MKDSGIAVVNYGNKQSGTALAARIHYDALQSLGYNVKWYQFADYFHQENYLIYPSVLRGSRIPFKLFRSGYDVMIKFPSLSKKYICEDYVYIPDPVLIKIGIHKKQFMLKVHDLIRASENSPSIASRIISNYMTPRIELANVIVVTTEYMKIRVQEYFRDSDRIVVVPEPIDESLTQNDSSTNSIRTRDGRLNVLYVATDRPYKNIRLFLDIAKYFSEHDPVGFQFTLVSRLSERTEQYAQKLRLSNINLLHNVEDMRSVYANNDVLLYTSLSEGFGRPIVESMAMGLPVIARKTQPFEEIIGESGTLLDNPKIEDWIEKLKALKGVGLYNSYSEKSRKRYYEKFSKEIFLKKLDYAFRIFNENMR